MNNTQHTPGPWRWEVNKKSKRVQLCGGKPKYDLTVMDFVRWGTQGAKPRFLTSDGMMLLKPVEEFVIPIEGREHHADWCAAINHPDAKLIEAAPDLLEAVLFAIQIKDLWTPQVAALLVEHENEAVALATMAEKFKAALQKAIN